MKTWVDEKTISEIRKQREGKMSNGFSEIINPGNKKPSNNVVLWFFIVTISTGFFLGFGIGLTVAILGVCK